jgi:predicted small lipoprotein YifL
MSRIAAVILTLCLAGCGMKGALVLPPGPAPEPLFGNPKPAPAPPTKSPANETAGNEADVSTDKKTPNE